MKQFRRVSLAALGLALGLGVSSIVAPVAHAAETESVRSEVGKPLQAAQDLIKQQKYKEALAKLHEAEGVKDLTAYETSILDKLRGIAASGAGDYPTAAKSYEAVIASGRGTPAEQLKLTQAVAGLYYQAKDYPKAITWVNLYITEGGTDPQTSTLLAQAYYLSNDFANAAKALQEQVAAEEHAGQPVPESQLQVLANSYAHQDDNAQYQATLEKLVAAYPKHDYWVDLIHRVSARSGFADRLQVDADRLSLAVGTLTTAVQYVEFAELSLQAGLPGEAKAILDKGYAAGILGTGPDAERHKRLRDLATKNAGEDLASLAASEKEAAAQKDGTALVNTGLDYVGHGQAGKGVELIEQGLQKGGLKRPDDAKLHLGLAYLAAGQKDKAVQTFKTVQGTDGTADLARLWALTAARSSS